MEIEKDEEGIWINPFKQPDTPFLSQLAKVFVKSFAYAHVTRKEALNIIGFMLSNYPTTVHEQLLETFIQLKLLQHIPSSIYYRILSTDINGVFTPILQCYSHTCNSRNVRQSCYSPTCSQKYISEFKQTTNSWLEHIPKNILEKTHRHEILRQAALADLLRMEQTYVSDLNILENVFAKPLLKSTCINENYRITFQKLLFGNYKSILKAHLQFIKILIQQSQKKNYIFFENVGKIISEHIDTIIEPYIIYTGNHIHSTYVLKKEIQRNSAFALFLELTIHSSNTRRLDISHFLTAPTLYIGKFRMLVEAIVKRTPSASEDLPILKNCVSTLHNLLLKMNETATEAGYMARRTQVMTSLINSPSARLFGCNKASFPPHVKLLCEGKINLHRSNLYGLSTSSTVPCQAFLFDHMLFLTQSKMNNNLEDYTLITKPIPLAAMICLNEENLHLSQLSPFLLIHRLSRHVASKLANRSSGFKNNYNNNNNSSPLLSPSTSTPVDTIFSKELGTRSMTSVSSSRFRQRLRASVRLSSPVYTLSSPQIALKKQQSVPELSLFNNNCNENIKNNGNDHCNSNISSKNSSNESIPTSLRITSMDDSTEDKISSITSANKNENENDEDDDCLLENIKLTYKSPQTKRSISFCGNSTSNKTNYRSSFIAGSTTSSSFTPFNRSRSSSSASASSSNNITLISTTNNNNNIDENKNIIKSSSSIYFIHAGSMDTIFGLEFYDVDEYQYWKDQIQEQLQSSLQSPFSLNSIWQMNDDQFKCFASLKNNSSSKIQKKISFKKYSNSFSSLPLSPSASTSTVSFHKHSLSSSKLALKLSHHDEVSNTIEIYCALPYESIYEEKMIALGTKDGVWIGLQQNIENDNVTETSINSKHGFIKIISLEQCHRLVLIEGMLLVMSYDSKSKYMLVAYPLLENDDYRDILVGSQSEERKSKMCTLKKRWVTVKRDHVISMVVGKLYHQTVLVYLAEYGPHLLAVVAVPKRSQAAWFKKVKEYNVCLKDANQIFLHNNTIYIQSNKYGVVSLVPSLKRETSVNWKTIIESACINYVPISNDYGLAITSNNATPIKASSTSGSSSPPPSPPSSPSSPSSNDNMEGSLFKKPLPLNFETQISFVSMSYPYLLAFSSTLIEIWNIETAKLVQVIQPPYVNCLYDSSKSIVFNNKTTQEKEQNQPTILLGPASVDTLSNKNNNNPASFQIYQLTSNSIH
ncbi:unnamed protein product [Cunninghamella blakesleeana]